MFIEKFERIMKILIGDIPSEYEWLFLIFLIVLLITVCINIKRCCEW